MKIIKFTAENVKRLKAVEISPDGTVQVITGRNAQGKTSVLDSIWLALGGGAAARETSRPIRAGQDKASVTLDLGDLVVTRTWSGDKTALTVKSADGAKYPSPQSVLDALVGRLSFDPLEFTRLSGRAQMTALLELVDLDVDLTELAERRQELYARRTQIGRDGKALEGQAAGLGPMEEVPAEEVSASDLIARIRAGQEQARQQETDRRLVDHRRSEVQRLEEELDAARDLLAYAEGTVAAHQPVEDIAALERELAALDETNRAVRRNAERRTVGERLDAARGAYRQATEAIEEIDRTKGEALAAASFPVPGLGFDEAGDGVTFDGVPFAQASAAEQIRVSLAMAMSLNPKLRVIRILDGSLLDADSMRLISKMAAERDYQVWVERVADGSGVGVVIEDGQVVA